MLGGTIFQARHPWIDHVKAHPAVTLLRLTAATREAVLADLLRRIRATLG